MIMRSNGGAKKEIAFIPVINDVESSCMCHTICFWSRNSMWIFLSLYV